MRLVVASTFLVLAIGGSSCAKTTVDSQLHHSTSTSVDTNLSIGAVELLETMNWPSGVAPINLSSVAESQLRRTIFEDVELAASVRDIAAVGLTIDGQPNGALMLIGVADSVVGNISFLDGLKSAALASPEPAHWGPITGSSMRSDDQIWGMLPLTSVVVVAVTNERSQLDKVMNSLVRRFTRP